MDEKGPLHISFPTEDSVQVGKRGRIRWPLWVSLLVCLPLVASLALFLAMSWPSEAMLMGALKLIHIDGYHAGLWLGFSGSCGSSSDGPIFCDLSFLDAYYNKTFMHVNLDTLEATVPQNLGYESTLLLAGLCAQALGVVFVIWGAFDFHRAEVWHFEQRRGWVSEWLISRRLDVLGSAFCIGGITAVASCAASTSIKLASAASAVNTLASTTRSDYSSAEIGKGTLALFGACIMSGAAILIELLVLAFDGLGHRIRSDYEDLVDLAQGLEDESWVSLEAKMHTLQHLAVRHTKAESLPDMDRRERARVALVDYLKASEIDSLLNEMQDKVNQHRVEVSSIRAQSQIAVAPAVTASQQAASDPRDAPPVAAGALAHIFDRIDNRERRATRAGSMTQASSVRSNESSSFQLGASPPRATMLGPIPQVQLSMPVPAQPLVDDVEARRQAFYANAAAAENALGDRDLPSGFVGGGRPPPAGQLGARPLDEKDPLSMPPSFGKGNKRFLPVFGNAL